jgi:hypothetical protein
MHSFGEILAIAAEREGGLSTVEAGLAATPTASVCTVTLKRP